MAASLAATQPLTFLYIQHGAPEGAAPTGLYTGDSGHHLLCMRAGAADWFSPFATCQSPWGSHSPRFFAAPIFLLYVAAGYVSRLLPLGHFMFLGILNGLGGALLLWGAWRLFRTAMPKRAHAAFLLFALPPGVGGVVYLAAASLGWTADPAFEAWFYRYAAVELIEGQQPAPMLLMPRFYYTLPLALGLWGLSLLWHARGKGLAGGRVLVAAAAFINPRLGAMLLLIHAFRWLPASGQPRRTRLGQIAVLFLTTLPASLAGLGLLRLQPHYLENVAAVARSVLPLQSYLTAAGILWLLALPALWHDLRRMPRWAASTTGALLGYAAGYAVLYAAHQVYFGNWRQGGELQAALFASNPAFVTSALGAVLGYLRPAASPNGADDQPWLWWWLLGFTCLALAAPLNGVFLGLGPQRFAVLLGPPLAMAAAHGLAMLPPRLGKIFLGIAVFLGLLSAGTGAIFFQSPAGRTPGKGPFAHLHYGWMLEADSQLMQALPPGTVPAPPWSPIAFGEVLALRPGLQVVGGPGAMNIGSEPFAKVQPQIQEFWRPGATGPARWAVVDKWCVGWVYCPATAPVDPAVLAQLRATPWLRELANAGEGAVFEVLKDRAVSPSPG